MSYLGRCQARIPHGMAVFGRTSGGIGRVQLVFGHVWVTLSCTSPHVSFTGLGDRMRGITFLLRSAIASKRVLLLDIVTPIPMVDVLVPSAIDWTMGGIVIPADAVFWKNDEGHDTLLLTRNTASNLTDRFVVTEGGARSFLARSTHTDVWAVALQKSAHTYPHMCV